MIVAGIDFSTKAIDIVLLREDDSAEWHRYELPKGPLPPAAVTLLVLPGIFYRRSNPMIEGVPVGLIGLERPYCRGFGTATALYEVRGAILAWVSDAVTVLSLPPQEWKLELTGYAKASKLDVRAAIVKLIPFTDAHDWPQDAFDAYGIAWAARAINQRAAET